MNWQEVDFSIDLVAATLRHLNFLYKVSQIEQVLTQSTLQHALRRYEDLWLPLANENRHTDIVAPIDIEWMWCVHMLSPLAYRRDCRKMFNKTLSHDFKAENSVIPGTNNAIEIWYEKYPSEGFNIIRNGEFARPQRTMNKFLEQPPSKLSSDIIKNAESYIKFSYQVALPHFRDRKYITHALKRYKQFLCLKKIEPDEFLTPSVDIMLLWFTHMCHPVAYATDSLKICGQVLDNNVRVKSGRVDEGFVSATERTKQFWRRITAEELLQPGTKLRSIEKRGEVFPMTLEDLTTCCIMVYTVKIDHVEITDLPRRMKFFLKIFYQAAKGSMWDEILNLKGPKRMWSCSSEFKFQSTGQADLSIVLLRKKKMWCFRGEEMYGTGSANLLDTVTSMDFLDTTMHLGVELKAPQSKRPIKVELEGSIRDATPHLCSLRMQKQPFKKQHLSHNAMRWAGGDVLRNNLSKDTYECYIGIHGMVNHESAECFRCRVLHVPEILHSGLQVFYNNKLVATSHIIGSSHLPSPAQVQTRDVSMAFDPELGERAMLIRNHTGDWGLCVARWMQESASYLDVRFMKLAGNKLSRIEVRNADVQFQSFNANLYTGKIDINPASNTVAENLATLWTICVLYVLCAPPDPRRKIALVPTVGSVIAAAEKGDIDDAIELSKTVYTEEQNCQMLLAAGMKTGTPNNQHILQQHGSLTADIFIDAQDITVEEQKTNKKLFKKEIKHLKGDLESLPKKRKKKKRSKLQADSVTSTSACDTIGSPVKSFTSNVTTGTADMAQQVKPGETNQGKSNTELPNTTKSNTKPVVIKTKRVKRKEISNLEDQLSMSDDSISKDDIEVKTKIVTDKFGHRRVLKKDSSLANEISPEEDSLDEAEKEENEFKQGHNSKNALTGTEVVMITAEQSNNIRLTGHDNNLLTGHHNNLLTGHERMVAIRREETRLIKDIAAKKILDAPDTDQLDGHKSAVFDLGENDTSGLGSANEDKTSDTSQTIRESRKRMRKRISQAHDIMYTTSDGDAAEITPVEHVRKHRKKSKRGKKELLIKPDAV